MTEKTPYSCVTVAEQSNYVAERIERVSGCGMNLVLLFLLLGCVVAETHECGSSNPTLARLGNSCGETAGSRVVESSEWDCATLDDSDDDDWTAGGCSCSRGGRQRDWQRKCMTQVELRDESVRCGRRPAAVRCRDQYGCGDQCTAWRCAVVCRPDHVVRGMRLESHGKCSTRLEYEGVAIFFSGMFPEGRYKVDVDSGTGGVCWSRTM